MCQYPYNVRVISNFIVEKELGKNVEIDSYFLREKLVPREEENPVFSIY